MRRGDLGLIKNAERFARIDLDRSRFEKERNHLAKDVKVYHYRPTSYEHDDDLTSRNLRYCFET